MTPDDFKDLLLSKDASEIVEQYITTNDPGPNVTAEAVDYMSDQARQMFQVREEQALEVIVVGSAKLGFSFLEKQKPTYLCWAAISIVTRTLSAS